MKDDLKKLFGYPPYDIPSNICWHDPYFAQSLEKKYQMSLAEMCKVTGIRPK